MASYNKQQRASGQSSRREAPEATSAEVTLSTTGAPETEEFGLDKYDGYAAVHDPDWESAWKSGGRRRTGTPLPRRLKRSYEDVVGDLTDEAAGLEAGFHTTYTPARYEEGFLLEALRYFYDVGLIQDVLANVKGGKEANVYRCLPAPTIGVEYVAAKVYRPRRFRNLRNDKMYREGRNILSADGKTVKANERRTMAALRKKTTFGAKVAHTSWMMYEFSTMEDLWHAGARVPRPYAVSENAILMGYVGDGGRAAPTLHEIDLDSAEAARLFDVVMDNVERMMKQGIVHGDLSAYNILYWDGDVTLIDFPQVTDIHANPNAARILQRDLQRVCAYFQARGVRCQPGALAADLWQRYHPTRMQDMLADLSRADAGDEEEEEVSE
jgi:RIO kinase 1